MPRAASNRLPEAAASLEPDLLDLRFRALIPDPDWESLPPAVRRRFAKRVPAGASAVYVGRVVETRMSRLGRLLAQGARLLGGPLPYGDTAGLAAVVTVTEEPGGGQAWTRLYARPAGLPQVIHSAKRFRGPTGLEEHVGAGFGMALHVAAANGALVFRSAFYFWNVLGVRLRLPALLAPGALTVTHAETGDGTFRFVLEIRNPRLGLLIRQEAVFRDTAPTTT